MNCRVKVCGITDKDNAVSLAELGVDALGFIFVKSSKRFIKPDDAKTIIAALPPLVKTVGVFVDASLAEIEQAKREAGFDLCQLHGNELPNYVRMLKFPAIKSFVSDENLRKEDVESYTSVSGILLDASSGGMKGGTGKECNWEKAREMGDMGYKVILAGGLSDQNLKRAVETVKPYAVDLNSGVEDSPGKKSIEKVGKALNVLSNM